MSPSPLIGRSHAAIGTLFLALALAGCASTGGLQPAAQVRDADSHAVARSLAGATLSEAAFPAQDWWRAFGDPQLDALVAEALDGSPSLVAADARLRKARAQAGLAEAARKPSVGASAQYAVAQLPESLAGDEIGGELMHNAVLMLNFDWPLDVWGGRRADYEAALGQARASEVDAQAARLALAANVSRAYIALAQAFESQDLARREQERSERLLQLSRQRVDAGIDGALSLRNAEGAIASAKAQAEAARQQVDALRNTLAALLGKGPDRGLDIARPRLLQAPAPTLPGTLPSELLGHRPDVVAARWRVEAAARGIDSAKATFKPSIDLSGLVGLASAGFSDLFDGDALLGFGGPAVSLPVFDAGARRNRLDARNADYDLAVASYNQGVVEALHEVTDAVQAIRSLDAQERSLQDARASAEAALQLAEGRYRAGIGSQLEVLAAQRPLLQVEQQLAALRAQRYLATVDLDRALGGGLSFDAPATAPTDPESNS
ncbi:RND efflux system, outer membrane lipoprotein, NodT family [Pseudoxanthomonas suwonensis 11-1]|uniref:RND efflux system, outer membrane lipoprotein, NodT family n=1 Tax=Pseudoxanthomonas suwonensis (strain 11-1) TaxID=743721 RepID=E6WRP1_PSEUU|nr:efflux transporter outer membrane subunit [Pseudoxanthomonas suwonensis]ADV26840.1 RND efflux system, outer membrane lipoprotein, NodT family [Pseudoxanthomonas suwonensis 11-1]